MSHTHDEAPSRLEYHVLLAMADGPLYGYALTDRVHDESGGTLSPRAGTLYRVLGRLMARGLVDEVEPEGATPPHPGRDRKYYGLTGEGRALLADESHRLQQAAALAARRLGLAEGGG